ncbi:P22 coat - protein 5 family protein [Paraburkholderia atlantica]|uniref:P22 coat - protein 5 family protein n=1 Tax=Paraburkholderia atlantica TaxID=2654982 RepID=UPI001608436F|nr:P22 coat - protein 5 family protein [Paraburkholderia atlantica]MBB5508149.1 hypothetical protein [Paraburkholderia atlantica]
MANTLSSLIPDLYESLDVVSRELVGFIPAVTLDPSIARAAIGENVRSFVAPASSAEDVSPGQLPPDDGDQSIGNVPIVITKSRMVPFRWTGEEQKGVNHGPGYTGIRTNQITQAMRTLTNEIEAAVGQLVFASSRATGTAGTTPFASDLSATAQARKILSDNGAPLSDLQCVVDTTSGASLRTLMQLTKANEAGTTELRAQGTLLELHGFKVRESAGVATHVSGTGASYVTNGALAVGATTIPVQTGSGTILVGDVITLAGDTNKYVVTTALTGGNVVIAAPGLRKAATSGTAVTVGAAYTGNAFFSRNAFVLSTRLPALPQEGDMADDRTTIVDPRSGLAFEVSMYRQYRRVRYEIACAYGMANIKPEHSGILLG